MRRICLIMFLIFLTLSVFAQQRPYINYTTHSGLPQIQVRAIHQDHLGYIWVGTKSGLVKFNGEEFENYLPNKSIYEIESDSKGRVYVKTYDQLYRFDGRDMLLLTGFKNPAAVIIGNEEYWILAENCLFQYQDTLEIKRFVPDVNFKGVINSVAYVKDKARMYFTMQDLNQIYRIVDGEIERETKFEGAVKRKVLALKGEVIVLVEEENEDIHYLNPVDKSNYFSVYRTNNRVDSIKINHLPVKNYLYVNDYSFYRLDSVTKSFTKFDLAFIKAPYPAILDRDNNIWAGSDNGLYQIFNGPISNFPRSFMNDFWTMIKGDDGHFYGAVYKDALYRLDMKSQTKEEILAPGPFHRKETDYYYGASKDKKGFLYFPTHYGLVKYNYKNTKKFDTGISLITKYDSVSNRIIFGQMNGLGFIDENENIEILIDSSKQLVPSHPKAIDFDEEGNIWIGTNGCLTKYDRKKKCFSKIEGGPKYGVFSIHKDVKGNFWMGGKDGLWFYNSQNEEFRRVDDGIIENNIAGIISKSDELLIVGTSLEVFAMDLALFYSKGNIRMKLFNFRNGFLSEEVCQNGFLLDKDLLYVPSTTCTSVIDLHKVNFDTDFYDVRITSLNDKGIIYSDTISRSEICMENGCNELDLSFEAIGFGLPTNPMFKYKLDGVDKTWSDWTKKKYANYRNLASGNYCFHVMARPGGNPNVTTQKEDHLHLKISLPFYKEPRFYQHTLIGFVILVLILGFFVHSRIHIKMKMLDRERKIKFLEIATLQAQLNPHFVFNILSSVQNLISLHKPEKANEYLIKFSRLIRAYMEASIKSSKVLLGASVSSEITIKEEVDLLQMYIELEQVKHKERKFDFEIKLDSDDLQNKTIPPMILQPLVENAIKHGLEPGEKIGFLQIRFSDREDGVECMIRDNGIGRERSQQNKKDSIKLYQSRGLELINKKIEILNDLDYKIKIEYKDLDEGTEVSVTFTN